jgi:hypothetical protein
MKNGKHSTSKAAEADVWEFHDGSAGKRQFDLEDRLLEFTSAVIDLSESLPATRAGNHVAGQILRSGTSPCPNHGEDEAAESREDFIHKLKICLKEIAGNPALGATRQTQGLGERRNHAPVCAGRSGRKIRIFHSSIQTAKRNAEAQARKPSNPVRY